MNIATGRRTFLRRAGGTLAAAGAVGGGLSAWPLLGARSETVTQTRESQSAIAPEQALQMLKDGNARFLQGRMLQRDLLQQVRETGAGQFPFAAIVSCIDSRESAQLTFDQGIGDVFSVRVAGNFVNDDMLGSLEFACALAGARLILVLGHTECGAIRAACDDVVFGNLTQTLANLKPAVAAVSDFEGNRTSNDAEFVSAVATMNVQLTVERIQERSQILRDMVDEGLIDVRGAMYDVHTGEVTFM